MAQRSAGPTGGVPPTAGSPAAREPGPAAGPPGVAGVRRALVWSCVLIFVNQLGFGGVAPVVALYAQEFDVSTTAIGLTIAVYGAARFLLNVPTGQIADRHGRRVALAVGGGVTVAGNLVCGLAGTYWLFLGGRFVAGAGAAMVITATQIVVADISTPENRGRSMGLYQGTFLFAVGLGPLPGGLLAERFSLATPFLLYAAAGVGVAVLAWSRIPETRARDASGATVAAGTASLGQRLGVLLRRRGFVMVAIVSFTAFFARTGALFNLIPTLGDGKLGLTPSQIALGLSIVSLVAFALAVPSGVLVDRFGRKAVIVPSTVVGGVAMVLFAAAPSYAWFLTSCVAWAVAVGLSGPAPAAYAADSAPPGMLAPAMGVYRMLADAGYVVGPLLLGATADLFDTETALVATGALVAASGVAFALLAPETRPERSA